MRRALFLLTLVTACGGNVVGASPDASTPILGGPEDASAGVAPPVDAALPVDAAPAVDGGEDAAVDAGFCEGCDPAHATKDRYCVVRLSAANGGACDGTRYTGTIVSTTCAEGIPGLLAGCAESDAGTASCAACGPDSTACIQYSVFTNQVSTVVCLGP